MASTNLPRRACLESLTHIANLAFAAEATVGKHLDAEKTHIRSVLRSVSDQLSHHIM